MNKRKLRLRAQKILNEKNKSFKRKYYILSEISSTNIYINKDAKSEFKCYLKSLVESNGKYPSEKSLLDFYESRYSVKSKSTAAIKNLKETIDLQYSNLGFTTVNDIINEEMSASSIYSNQIDKKLYSIMLEGMKRNISILNEGKTIDLTSMFDDVGPRPEELANIESEEDIDDFSMSGDDSSELGASAGKTIDKIIDIFKPIIGGDPAKMSKQKIATNLGYTGTGKYVPGQKNPVLSGWDVLERDVTSKMSAYGKSSMSIVAKRKWWILKSIECCLMLSSQARFFLGISDEEKSRLDVNNSERDAAASFLKSRGGLNKAGRDAIVKEVHTELLKGDYDLNSSAISEARLMMLLKKSSADNPSKQSEFESALEMMYPLSDNRADFEKVPMQSDEERSATQGEVEDYFSSKDQETKQMHAGEIDPETGEPLYTDEEEISKINRQKSEDKIETEDIISDIKASNYFNFTSLEVKEYLQQISKDLERLKELELKTKDRINPEIFSEFKYDTNGNLIDVPDVIPAEELTAEEKKEFEEIIERFATKDVIKMINDSEREQIYQELVDKAVTVDEFIRYNRKFRLENGDKPMTWEDIKRASAGEFTGSQGARQYGVKAWIKSVFLNFSPSDKAEIYSYIAERWYERLKQLDLIDDQSFAVKSDKVNPNDPSLDKAIPRSVLDKAQAAGKYSRSQKLVDVSNMLELINKYTSPRFVKRYFDEKRDDNLPQAVGEKIRQIQTFADSEEEYDSLTKRLEAEDPDTMAFAIMESMFNDNSGFRIFATGLMKEYYNNIVWPGTEVGLAQAVKEYFKQKYPSAGIAKSLASNEGAGEVKPDEGKDLFNKIIYIVMERTGIKTSGKGVPNVGQSREEQKNYMRGKADSRGDFVKVVDAYNRKFQQGKRPLLSRYGSGPFNQDDLEDLIDDMFSPNGIIGKVGSQMKRLNQTSAGEIISWVGDYPEAKLDQAIVLGMSLSDFYRRTGASELLTLPIEQIGKDTSKALNDYKKKYKSQLLSKDFVEFLDDYLGIEPVDVKAKGSKNPGGKSFQWVKNEFTEYYDKLSLWRQKVWNWK